MGWNWAVQAARDHDVCVLTWTKFREPIERYLGEHANPNLHVVYYDLPRWARRFAISERLHYLLWQLFVLPLARRLQKRERFDVVHHLTFNSVEVPGLLWTLGVPYVWGPVGGGQVPPAALKSYFKSVWLAEMARRLRKRFLSFNPLVRIAAKRAAYILVSNRDTMKLLQPLARAPLIEEMEIATRLPDCVAPAPREDCLTILWAGRFIPRKGPLLALDVANELKRRDLPFRMLMAGDGPWEEKVTHQRMMMGLTREVRQVGALGYGQMPSFYAGGDVFLFTSLQDTSGNVVLEAMSYGLPVVSLDQHGAATLLTDECGIKVPVVSQRQVVQDMASALEKLARDRQLGLELGAAGRERVACHYTWDHKAALLRRLYAEAAGVPCGPEPQARALVTAADE